MTSLNVLIVDDEPGMRLGAERTLSNYTFRLEEFNDTITFDISLAEDGKSAFKVINSKKIDLLILDHKLPDTQGLEILSKIKEEHSNILTIMITAYASLEVAVSATKHGAFDFLAKPFTPDELRNTVKKAAEHVYLNRKAQELEEEKRQVRFQFISVLAHELKSPLSAVQNYLLIMNDKLYGNDLSKYSEMLSRSMIRIDGMRKLIADLLDLTKIESGKKERKISNIDIIPIIKEHLEDTEVAASQKGINIEKHFNEKLFFNIDKEELAIILNNILTNAVKYNKENGQVLFSTEISNNNLIIKCKDTGIGMTQEEKDRLFNEFVRIKNSKTKDIPGSGLGLSILKKLVDLYKGSIEVNSEPDKGTEFIITLTNISE